MGQVSIVLCDMAGNPLPQEWAIEDVRSASIMMEELDRFSPHSVTVTVSFRRNLALLNGLATAKILDSDIGEVAWGLIDNPEQQITASDDHTITLQLPNITEQLRYETTGQGWQAGGAAEGEQLSFRAIIRRIGSLKYGWSADVLDYGTEPFILRLEDSPLLGALVDAATSTFGHIRQGRDETGAPIRSMEIGYFGTPATMVLVSADGASANEILLRNPEAWLVESLVRHPADATKLTNVVTPLGGGTGGDQVRMRHLFRILYDPTYEHFAATPELRQLYFPEYEDAFPIPALYNADLDLWQPARPMKGDSNRMEPAARLDVAAGGFEYCVVHSESLNHFNELFPHEGAFRAQFADSQFSYTSDPTLLNQELSERALYAAAKGHLRWYGYPQKTITATVIGNRRPPRAGSQIVWDYRRVGYDLQGEFAALDEQGSYTVVSVQRNYDAMGTARNVITMTNNGLGPPDNAPISGSSARKLIEAIRMIPVTSSAPAVIGPIKENLDPQFPMTVPVRIPSRVYRVSEASLDVEFEFHRADVALDGAGPIINDGGHLDPNGVTHSLALSGGQNPVVGAISTPGIRGIPSGGVVNTNTDTPDGTTSFNSIPGDLTVWQDRGLSSSYGLLNYAVGLLGPAGSPGTAYLTGNPLAYSETGVNNFATFGQVVPDPVNGLTIPGPIGGYDASGNGSATGHYSQLFVGSVGFTGRSGLPQIGNGFWTVTDATQAGDKAGRRFQTYEASARNSEARNLNHFHFIQVGVGKNQPAMLAFVPQGDESFLGTSSGDTGRFHTNTWEQKSGGENPNHSHPYGVSGIDATHAHDVTHDHVLAGSGVANHTHDITHRHDISHLHDITHTHNISHLHDFQHVHSIDHTHDMRHYHDITHYHSFDHFHYFPHTHQMNAGIFETTFKPARIQLWIDSGDGSFVDRSPDLGGPWTDSFSLRDISQYVNAPGKKVRLQFISINTLAQGFGLGALTVSGTWTFETSSATGTVFAG